MPSAFRQPKTLADWTELDYFQRPRPFRRLRRVVTWVVLLATLATVLATVLALVFWPGSQRIYESRPVSSAHTMFNSDCNSCHVESFRPGLRFLTQNPQLRSVSDETCQKCHPGSPHHPDRVATSPGCASCHEEHRGQLILSRVTDGHCTACHTDLEKRATGPCTYFPTIHGFASDHPDFGAWRIKKEGKELHDPGTLRFNHKVHLHLEAKPPSRFEKAFADLKQEQCSYCHQPDAAGRYMRPINYKNHCSQCHPLSIQVVGNWPNKGLEAAAQKFNAEPAPHEEPRTVCAALWERYSQFLEEHPELVPALEGFKHQRPIPGTEQHEQYLKSRESWVDSQRRTAERVLFDEKGGCQYCHQPTAQRVAPALPHYELTQITQRWFPQSKFSHERHRLLQCTECHAGAPASDRTNEMLMPTITDCRRCHSPQVGARTDCAECHNYHDHSREPFQGKLTISETTRNP